MELKLKNLHFLKRFYNVSSKKMAEILQVRSRQYSNIENGSCKLDENKMQLLSLYFNVALQSLLFEDLEKKMMDFFTENICELETARCS
jgi:transcriptional regulator with XRE-family HTH domain